MRTSNLSSEGLSVEFAEHTLARYGADYLAQSDRLRKEKRPRLFELVTFGEGGWLTVVKPEKQPPGSAQPYEEDRTAVTRAISSRVSWSSLRASSLSKVFRARRANRIFRRPDSVRATRSREIWRADRTLASTTYWRGLLRAERAVDDVEIRGWLAAG